MFFHLNILLAFLASSSTHKSKAGKFIIDYFLNSILLDGFYFLDSDFKSRDADISMSSLTLSIKLSDTSTGEAMTHNKYNNHVAIIVIISCGREFGLDTLSSPRN